MSLFLVLVLVLFFPNSAHAYIDAVGGGLIFQIGYVIFTGMLIFLAVPFKKIAAWFKRDKVENHSPERDKI